MCSKKEICNNYCPEICDIKPIHLFHDIIPCFENNADSKSAKRNRINTKLKSINSTYQMQKD